MKTCFKCDETKDYEEFYRHPEMGDGYLNKCKECTKRDVRAHRRISDSVRAYDVLRSKRPNRQRQMKENVLKYQERNPGRKAATTAVNNALRAGKLKKEPCHFCASEKRLEAHHHDYNDPLSVTWLCVKCHRRLHALERLGRLMFPFTVAK